MLTFTPPPDVSQLWSQSHVVSPLSWPPFTFPRRLTWLQWLRGPIRECCLCSSSLILISAATGTVSALAQCQSAPSAQTTTTPPHQSSESSLVYWPALKSGGNCVKSLGKTPPAPKRNLWCDRMCFSLVFPYLRVTTVPLDGKQEAAWKAKFQFKREWRGWTIREGARPNINDSCSYYSPRILRQA